MYNFVESAARKTEGGANTELCLPAFNKYSLQANHSIWANWSKFKEACCTTKRFGVTKYKDEKCLGKGSSVELQVQVVKTAAAVDVVLRKASAGLLQHQGLDQFQLGFHIPILIIGVFQRSSFLPFQKSPILNPEVFFKLLDLLPQLPLLCTQTQ